MERHDTAREAIPVAWQQYLKDASRNPFLLQLLLKQWQRIIARMSYFYAQLATLPRRNRRALQRALATSLIGAAMLLALSSAPIVHAAVPINVDGTSCTLDDAIQSANTDSAVGGCTTGYTGADTLNLTADITLAASLTQHVKSDITLQGNNHFISGNSNYSLFLVDFTGDLTVDHVTLKDGAAGVNGGAILVDYGTVTVQSSTLTGNYAPIYGGAVANYRGSVTITDSTLSNNTALAGGAVANYGSIADVTIKTSTLSGNSATGIGGAIQNYGGDVYTYDSTITGSTKGGGVSSGFGTLILGNDTLTKNYSQDNGGAVDCYHSYLTVSKTTISENSSYSDAGGVDLDICLAGIAQSTISGNYSKDNGNGGLDVDGSRAYVVNSTISGNSSVHYYGGIGVTGNTGGNYKYYGYLTLVNSTVTGNSSTDGHGGGVAIYYGGHVELQRNIVSGNTTNYDGSQIYDAALFAAKGGGAQKSRHGREKKLHPYRQALTARKGSQHGWGKSTGHAQVPDKVRVKLVPARHAALNGVSSDDFNLFGDNSQTTQQALFGFLPGASDITATSDGTMPTALSSILNTVLGNNGGLQSGDPNTGTTFVQTHALLLGSPAIDKAPNIECTPPPINSVDERNLARNVNINNGNPANLCDIGAYELQTTTAVDVSSVTARLGKAGHIVAKWRTLSESQIAGFDIYRQVAATTNKGKRAWKHVNAAMIEAHHAGDAQGDKYLYKDKAVKPNKAYRYKVLVHYLDGHSDWTNIVTVRP